MADGPLGSDLLKDNDRLQRCAQFDGDNVEPGEPASTHVRLIQDALRKVDNANIPAGETDYGEKTTEAVVNFKTKHRIFTRGTQSIDPIVGINTSRKLDELMQTKEEEERKRKQKPPKVVPKLALSGQCQVIGQRNDDPNADDMKFADEFAARKSLTTNVMVAPFMLMEDFTLESAMVSAMGAAVIVASKKEEGPQIRVEALAICAHFFGGGGVQKNFPKGSVASNAAKTDDGFKVFVGRVNDVIIRQVRFVWKSGFVSDVAIAALLRATLDAPGFGTGQFSGGLAAFIGGFQGYHIKMCNFAADTATETFTYNLDVEIFDHFGVSDDDINRNQGALGATIGTAMASFFVLQHDRSAGLLNRRLNKYRPCRVTLRVDMGPFTGRIL